MRKTYHRFPQPNPRQLLRRGEWWQGAVAGGKVSERGTTVYDVVRRQVFQAGSSVSRIVTREGYGSVHTEGTSATGLIDLGPIPYLASWTGIVRFTSDGTAGGSYGSVLSRGGVFESNTNIAFGMRQAGLTFFNYADAAGKGTEAGASASVDNDTAITIIATWTAGAQELWVSWNSDHTTRTTAGTLELVVSSASAANTDGGQNLKLMGPNTFTNSDRTMGGRCHSFWLMDRVIPKSMIEAVHRDPNVMFRDVHRLADFVPAAPPAGGFFGRRYYDQHLTGGQHGVAA